jgi:hypothetical protein
MSVDLRRFLEDEYEYLLAREGRDFFLALDGYVTALDGRPEIREVLSTLQTELGAALQRFADEQNALRDEAAEIRKDLAERAPEIDNSGMERPDPRSHAFTAWDLDSFARLVPLKTDKSARDVYLSEPLAAVLWEQRGRVSSVGFVFGTRNGTPLSHRNSARALTDACTTAGIRRVGFHVLRHGFASELIVGLGLDIVQVSRQLGHAAPSITLDTYSHLFDRARHAADIRTAMASSGLAAAVTGGG